jgi:Protein of unknown function (DUF3143)
MSLPAADTPLYNHPLPSIETWLRSQGCEQDADNLHHWAVQREAWSADLWLEVDSLTVRYIAEGKDIQRTFKYSLSRQDLDEAIFSGP